jgi:hypothetical protein
MQGESGIIHPGEDLASAKITAINEWQGLYCHYQPQEL